MSNKQNDEKATGLDEQIDLITSQVEQLKIAISERDCFLLDMQILIDSLKNDTKENV